MEYLGNYAYLVQPEWIEFLLKNVGQLLPDDRECLRADYHSDNADMYNAWRVENRAYWYKYETQDLPFTVAWPVPLTDNIDWWAIKQLPGQCIPMHSDTNPLDRTTRYILMLQDYLPGHVLIWNNNFVNDYKKGDIFKISDVNAYHGSSNISNVPRMILHLTVWS